MKKLHLVNVRGEQHSWGLRVEMTMEAAADMREDGFDVHEAYYIVPEWMFTVPYLPRLWCFLQDVFYLRNPFTK